MEDVGTLEVAGWGNAVIAAQEVGVGNAQDFRQLLRRPDKELTLDAFAVGVLSGIEAALRVGHFAQHIIEGFLGNAAVEGPAGKLPSVEIEAGEQGVVVEHFLEMRHQPVGIGGVAVKAAANLVVHSPVSHFFQGQLDHFQRTGAGAAVVVAEQEFRGHGLGELGGGAKAAVLVVEVGSQVGISMVQDVLGQKAAAAGQVAGAAHLGGQLLGNPGNFTFVVAIGFAGGLKDAGEAGHIEAVGGRKVGAAIEGLALGGEKDGHRPAAAAGEHLDGFHIDGVEVGAFLAVNLDVDEVVVHQGSDGGILEGFALHYMAPVAGGVADAEEDGLVLGLGAGQCFRPPRVPVHGVMGVLKEVGAGFVDEAVGHRIVSFWQFPGEVRGGRGGGGRIRSSGLTGVRWPGSFGPGYHGPGGNG